MSPDLTDNHDLQLFEVGQESWTHAPDMQTLEERVWVRDEAANRPLYTPYEDALFLATDTHDVSLGDGEDWDAIGRISYADGGNGGDLFTGRIDVSEHVDDTGSTPINATIGGLWEEDTLLVFPRGEYLVNGASMGPSADIENYGAIGHGATLVREDSSDTDWIFDLEGHRLYLGGFTCDITTSGAGGHLVNIETTNGYARLENWQTNGFNEDHDDVGQSIRMAAYGQESLVVAENVRQPDGSEAPSSGDNRPSGFTMAGDQHGTVRMQDCYIAGFHDNGLYCRHGPTPEVYNSTFINNVNGAQIRIKDNHGGIVEGCRCIRDGTGPHPNDSGTHIRVQSQTGQITVRNCRVIDDVGMRAFEVKDVGEQTGVTIENCDIYYGPGADGSFNDFRVDEDEHADRHVHIKDITWVDDGIDRPGAPVRIQGTHEVGEVIVENFNYYNYGGNVDDAPLKDYRGSIWRDCTVVAPDSSGSGIRAREGGPGRIENCEIDVGGVEMRLQVDDWVVEDTDGTIEEGYDNRVVRDGIGHNSGDPNSTGQWNGEGYDGLTVLDTSNDDLYLYADGSWRQIG